MQCEECGKEKDSVRDCCLWPGHRRLCDGCQTNGTPDHICGRGLVGDERKHPICPTCSCAQ